MIKWLRNIFAPQDEDYTSPERHSIDPFEGLPRLPKDYSLVDGGELFNRIRTISTTPIEQTLSFIVAVADAMRLRDSENSE